MNHQLEQGFSSRTGDWRGWAAGSASALAYGSMPVAAVIAFHGGASPAVLLTLRGLLGILVIAALWLLTCRVRRVPLRPALGLLVLGGPVFAAQVLAFFVAAERGGAQIPVVIANVCPLFVIGLVWLRDRTPIPRPLVVIALIAMVGLVLVTGTGGGTVSMTACWLALFSAAGYAVYLVMGERWVHRVGTVASAGLVTIGSTATTAVFALLTGETFAVAGDVWAAAAVQGMLLMPIGMAGALYAVRLLGSVPQSLLGALEPVVGLSLAAALLHERLGPIQWVGVATIVVTCAAVPFVAGGRSAPAAAAQHPLNGIGAGESPLPDTGAGCPDSGQCPEDHVNRL